VNSSTAQVYDTNVDSASRVMSKMENGKPLDGQSSTNNMARATIKARVFDEENKSGEDFVDMLEVSEVSQRLYLSLFALQKVLISHLLQSSTGQRTRRCSCQCTKKGIDAITSISKQPPTNRL
jgi:response regulator of citrate/malate metabolism